MHSLRKMTIGVLIITALVIGPVQKSYGHPGTCDRDAIAELDRMRGMSEYRRRTEIELSSVFQSNVQDCFERLPRSVHEKNGCRIYVV